MGLKELTEQERREAAKLLADYWKDRGMPQYDKTWAKEYLIEGHKKEVKKDEFFVYTEGGETIGTISLITDVSDVAEIRDMVVKPKYRNKDYGKKMLEELMGIARERKIRKLYAFIFPQSEKMYRSVGFEKEGVLKNHFVVGEDLTIMSKFL